MALDDENSEATPGICVTFIIWLAQTCYEDVNVKSKRETTKRNSKKNSKTQQQK